MDLAPRIRAYYLNHFSELPVAKQFHFAGRLNSWTGDKACSQLLRERQELYVGRPEEYQRSLAALLEHQPSTHVNAFHARAPYFKTFEPLYGLSLVLFRIRHLLHIYGHDSRNDVTSLISLEALHALSQKIAADPASIRVLSTYAINYLYLTEELLFEPRVTLPLQAIYEQFDEYDQTDPEQIRLLIYLYTHCIIADSNFYDRAVPQARLPLYRRMLERLERLIQSNLRHTSLDTKLEFLVCAALCDYSVSEDLRTAIFTECETSLSPDGTFLIDIHNVFAGRSKTSFAGSEHRNALFIMAATTRPTRL